jgi:hypothetical protein
MEMSICISEVKRLICGSSCSNDGILTFGLSIEFVNEKYMPPFGFFLHSYDELEPQDSFFLSSLIEMSSCASGVGRSNLNYSCSGG